MKTENCSCGKTTTDCTYPDCRFGRAMFGKETNEEIQEKLDRDREHLDARAKTLGGRFVLMPNVGDEGRA